jgi:murein DD-endopeptidase MepM/ murein hydrolase activator NlpD
MTNELARGRGLRARHLAAVTAVVTASFLLSVAIPARPTRASDPLADAQAQQQQIQNTLSDQKAQLAALKAQSAALAGRLSSAEAALAAANVEYDRVAGLLHQVRDDVAASQARLAELHAQIADLDAQLVGLAAHIAEQTADLATREALLQDHLRAAYEASQTSLLEIVLASDSFESITNQVSYLLTVSDQDRALAEGIREVRSALEENQATLRQGREEVASARDSEQQQANDLAAQEVQLEALEARAAALAAAAEQRRAEQEAALNAAVAAQGDVQAAIAASEKAAKAAAALVAKLQAEAAQRARISDEGFRWPEDQFHVTQEWGPTTFVLEPSYTYKGTYYPHFHGGIDLANGCGTRILAAGTGVVVASGQPLWPYDSGFGVVIDHGGGVMTWYWHLQTKIVVHAGQEVAIGQLIGYEGRTGMATGCHLHFAVNDHGVWTNPRWYLP